MKKIIFCLFCGILTLNLITGCESTILKNNQTNSSKDDSNLNENKEDEDKTYDGKWGISSGVSFDDEKYGLIKIIGYGNCTYKITDSTLYNSEYVDGKVRNALSHAFSIVIPKSYHDFYLLMFSKNEIEAEMLKIANEVINKGIKITSIDILSINLTEDSEKIVNQQRKEEILKDLQQ